MIFNSIHFLFYGALIFVTQLPSSSSKCVVGCSNNPTTNPPPVLMNESPSTVPIFRRETIADCTQTIVDCASAKAIIISYMDGGTDELAYGGVATTLLCRDEHNPYFSDESNRAVVNVICYGMLVDINALNMTESISYQVERS